MGISQQAAQQPHMARQEAHERVVEFTMPSAQSVEGRLIDYLQLRVLRGDGGLRSPLAVDAAAHAEAGTRIEQQVQQLTSIGARGGQANRSGHQPEHLTPLLPLDVNDLSLAQEPRAGGIAEIDPSLIGQPLE
jgi:hypothetical protein